MSADPLPERDAPCILGTWGGGAGAVEFGEEEFGRWGFCRSLPGGKPAGDSASQHPGYPPETPGFCGGSFRTPTLGLGVSHIPHLLVPRPRRPWLLVPDLALGTSPPFPEGQAPRGAVAGAGSAGLRAAGRSRRGRTGRGAPTGLGFLSPSSETRRAEGDAHSFSPATHASIRFHSCVQPLIHTVHIHSKFLPLATQHSKCTYCVPASPGQLRRATVQRGSQLLSRCLT